MLTLARVGLVLGALAVSAVLALCIVATGLPQWAQIALALVCGPCLGAAWASIEHAIDREDEC